MSQPSQEQQAIQPPADDRLGVLTATAYVMQQAQYLTLDMQATQVLAERWANEPWPEQAGLDALHFSDGTERTVNWVLLLDALNFCFWGEPGQPRWQIEWHDQLLDGYYALAAALSRTIEAGRPLWDAGYLANMTEEELADILRPVSGWNATRGSSPALWSPPSRARCRWRCCWRANSPHFTMSQSGMGSRCHSSSGRRFAWRT